MHKSIIKSIINSNNKFHMEHLEELLIDLIDDLKVFDHAKYLSIEHELYCLIHGQHLSNDLAHHWVSQMKNKDGTHGEHWTMEQTSQFAEHHNPADWYAVMNMVYSDYYNPRFSINDYVELAKDWITDPDVGPGKTLRYYLYVVKER